MKTRQIILDDTYMSLDIVDEFGEETIKFCCEFEYYEAVKIVLTKFQFDDYTGDDEREFTVREDKILDVKKYLETSIWE